MNRRVIIDRAYTLFAVLMFVLLMIPLLHIIASIVINGVKRFNLDLIATPPESIVSGGGGILHAIVGTVLIIFVATIISFPLGLLSGLYLAEFAKGKFSHFLRTLINILAGVPSIIAGIFAYTIIVVNYGFSVLAGGLALGIIAIPYVARSTEEALKAVPIDIKEAGYALGVEKWKVVLFINMGYAKYRIFAGFLLSLARIIGETAPLLVTILGGINIPTSLLSPSNAIPLVIYQYALSPFGVWHEIAWAAAFFLMILVLGLNLIVRYYLKLKIMY